MTLSFLKREPEQREFIRNESYEMIKEIDDIVTKLLRLKAQSERIIEKAEDIGKRVKSLTTSSTRSSIQSSIDLTKDHVKVIEETSTRVNRDKNEELNNKQSDEKDPLSIRVKKLLDFSKIYTNLQLWKVKKGCRDLWKCHLILDGSKWNPSNSTFSNFFEAVIHVENGDWFHNFEKTSKKESIYNILRDHENYVIQVIGEREKCLDAKRLINLSKKLDTNLHISTTEEHNRALVILFNVQQHLPSLQNEDFKCSYKCERKCKILSYSILPSYL